MASSSGLALLQRNEAGAKFRTVHQLTYRERLLAKTGNSLSAHSVFLSRSVCCSPPRGADPRVAVASASALAACQPPIPREGSSTEQNSDLPEQSRQLKAALTELSTLRSEMAAMQAAVAYLRGACCPQHFAALHSPLPTF